jgi:hypothetical protein
MAETAELFDEIEDYVRRAVAPLVAEIAALKAQIKSIPAGPKGDAGERGADGVNGKDGRDGERGADGLNGKDAEVDYDRIGSTIAVAVEKEVGKFPTPRDGRDGKDGRDGVDGKNGADGMNGKDADTDLIVRRVLELVPKPENGKDGAPGLNGKDGAPGLNGNDGERGADGVAGRDADESAIVTKVLALIPAPANGKDGAPGLNGKDGESIHPDSIRVMVNDAVEVSLAKAVAGMPKPVDGKSVDPAEVALLVNSEISRQLEALVPYIKGEPGDPGFSPDDLDITYDEEQDAVLVRLRKGDRVIERSVHVPFPRDGGVFRTGTIYRKGRCANYASAYWIAIRDTGEKGWVQDDWRLVLKRHG